MTFSVNRRSLVATLTAARETLDDLLAVEEKAELIDGHIVMIMPSGHADHEASFEIAVSLRTHARVTGRGRGCGDGMGFVVPELTSGRESFSPDAAYTTGPLPNVLLKFCEGVPDFAVEVRSESDYGPAAEMKLAEKRADYFEAGTQVVWDVDTEVETITRYRASDPDQQIVYRRGDTAEAEPAVPGWRLRVDDIFT